MARYDPEQPFWKRAVAGFLDLLVSFTLFGNVLARLASGRPAGTGTLGAGSWISFKASGFGFELAGVPALALFVLVIAYFVLGGRTGGTLFQRLFGFRRA